MHIFKFLFAQDGYKHYILYPFYKTWKKYGPYYWNCDEINYDNQICELKHLKILSNQQTLMS